MPTQLITKNREFNHNQVKRIIFRRLAIVVWFSFLITTLQSMFFFAMFDPLELAKIALPNSELSRMQGYTFIFLFLWFFSFLTGLFCGVIMALPRRKLAKKIQK